MRRNRTEGRPVVYLDETWCNAHDGKTRAWVEEDKTCRGGIIGGPQGSAKFTTIHSFNNIATIIIASHQEKENALLCCTQVAKMGGSPVSSMYVFA